MDNPKAPSQLSSQEGLSQAGEQVEKNPMEEKIEELKKLMDEMGLVLTYQEKQALEAMISNNTITKPNSMLDYIHNNHDE